MEHIAAILLLLACSDNLKDCEEAPGDKLGYESLEACETDIDARLRRFMPAGPVVYGQCVEVDPLALDKGVVIGWQITSDGALSVAVKGPIEDGRVVVAMDEARQAR